MVFDGRMNEQYYPVLCFSGGTSITVMGVGLDLIQKPEFFVTYGGQFFTSVSVHDTLIAAKYGCVLGCSKHLVSAQNI